MGTPSAEASSVRATRHNSPGHSKLKTLFKADAASSKAVVKKAKEDVVAAMQAKKKLSDTQRARSQAEGRAKAARIKSLTASYLAGKATKHAKRAKRHFIAADANLLKAKADQNAAHV